MIRRSICICIFLCTTCLKLDQYRAKLCNRPEGQLCHCRIGPLLSEKYATSGSTFETKASKLPGLATKNTRQHKGNQTTWFSQHNPLVRVWKGLWFALKQLPLLKMYHCLDHRIWTLVSCDWLTHQLQLLPKLTFSVFKLHLSFAPVIITPCRDFFTH